MKIESAIQLLNKSNLNKDYVHSYILNILRGFAALQVCVHHFRNHFYLSYNDVVDPGIIFKAFAFATGFANHAVMVFFAISGWLVGGSVLNNFNKDNFTINYAIDRISRLWTVIIPTLFISLGIIMFITNTALPNDVFNGATDIDIKTFLGNMFGLQTVFVEQYAANYPLWSLANETWYYISFPLLLAIFLPTKSKNVKLISLISLALIAIYLPNEIMTFSIVWLLGALFSRIKINTNLIIKSLFLLLSLGAMTYGRYKNIHNDIFIIISYILPLLLFLSANQKEKYVWMKKESIMNKGVDFLSNISFSLYVLHVPLIYLSHSIYISYTGNRHLTVNNIHDGFIFAGLILASISLTYIFHILFEQRHLIIRKKIKEFIFNKKNDIK